VEKWENHPQMGGFHNILYNYSLCARDARHTRRALLCVIATSEPQSQ